MSTILTHDRIKLSTGILTPSKGLLWGGNALQSISIGRHTPRNPQQAIGFLGIVDYTSGTITSDATLDTILTEGSAKADATSKGNSAYKYAGQQMTVGTESYVLTSAAVGFTANAPATANFGWLTSGMATYLDIQDQPAPEEGEESAFCVVMGDDGTGIELLGEWYSGTAPTSGTVQVIDATGSLATISDNGIPGGVQSANFSSTINRDQIMDIRSTSPVQFVTTYPIDVSVALELYCLPVATGMKRQGETGFNPATFRHQMGDLKSLAVKALGTSLAKHVTGGATTATADDYYVKAIGMRKTNETEAVSVGRYLSFNMEFTVADLLLPLPVIA